MDINIKIGAAGKAETTVDEKSTARAMGSGELEVFATPCMIGLMENAACEALRPMLPQGQTSVGTALDVKHTASTPKGMKVWASATVTGVDRRAVTFEVKAWDEKGEIGSGTHQRFIVDAEKFIDKTHSKLEK